jgi:hypothetical protein
MSGAGDAATVLFLRGLPFSMTAAGLLEGPVAGLAVLPCGVHLVMEADGRPHGAAFIELALPAVAARAVAQALDNAAIEKSRRYLEARAVAAAEMFATCTFYDDDVAALAAERCERCAVAAAQAASLNGAAGLGGGNSEVFTHTEVAVGPPLHMRGGGGAATQAELPMATCDKLAYAPQQRLFLVGEGNFTFASAFATHLLASSGPLAGLQLTATGYDDADTTQRLPDATAALAALAQCPGVTVAHSIDATALETHAEVTARAPFDIIRWNNPHAGSFPVGGHNTTSNQCLLEKFLSSAAPLLAPTSSSSGGGEIHIVSSQHSNKNWAIEAMGGEAGLVCVTVERYRNSFSNFVSQRSQGGALPDKEVTLKKYSFRRTSPADLARALHASGGAAAGAAQIDWKWQQRRALHAQQWARVRAASATTAVLAAVAATIAVSIVAGGGEGGSRGDASDSVPTAPLYPFSDSSESKSSTESDSGSIDGASKIKSHKKRRKNKEFERELKKLERKFKKHKKHKKEKKAKKEKDEKKEKKQKK